MARLLLTADGMREPAVLILHRAGLPSELLALLEGEGAVVVEIDDVASAPFYLLAAPDATLLLDVAQLGALALAAIRACRRVVPGARIVVSSADPRASDFARVLESGATALLPWPSPVEQARRTVLGGA